MATEQDLRRIIERQFAGANPLTDEEYADAEKRRVSDKRTISADGNWLSVIDYLDLSQTLAILSRNDAAIANSLGVSRDVLQKQLKRLRDLAPIRNRVCHARPLEPDDFFITNEIIRELSVQSWFPYTNLKDALHELETNISYPLTVIIPVFWKTGVTTIPNNLPSPDFDDTGFIGRDSDRQSLMSILLSRKDIITVTGEGGVGKTSLTLRCLYDLVEKDRSYDVVYWTTLKTNALTPSGIRKIANAMTSEVDVLSSLAGYFGSDNQRDDIEELYNAVREILGQFRVILVVDNTETISREALRPLFIDIPGQSKIVLTSRIGIGEFETRYPLAPMTPKDAIDLTRRTARLFNVDGLVQKHNSEVEETCSRLFYNPLAIRWFVQSYSEGKSVEALLDCRRDLAEVLKFCFQNLYSVLDEHKRRYLRILVLVGKPLSEVQIALLADDNDVEAIRSALRYLFSSNLLRRSADNWNGSGSPLWAPSDFAKEYISTHDKPLKDRMRYEARYRELLVARDIARDNAATNRFQKRTIEATSTDEATVVILLHQALLSMKSGNEIQALETVKVACKLLPEFYEVWRVSAQVKWSAGDILGATDDFEKAIELADGRSEPLLVYYAQFLLKQEQLQQAIYTVEGAAARSTAAPQLVATYAWLKMRTGDVFDAVTLFEAVFDKLRVLNTEERMMLLTQFAEALRRAAEIRRSRGEHREALTYVVRSLRIIVDACKGHRPDNYLVNTSRKCINEALSVIADRCDIAEWQETEPHIREVRGYFPQQFTEGRGVEIITRACPLITSRSDFKRLGLLSSSANNGTNLGSSSVLTGQVIRSDADKGFGFIRGDDGNEYFLHVSNYCGTETWRELCQMQNPYLQFRSSENQGDKNRRALDVYLVAPDIEF